jgi:hypothetical protein
MSCRAAKFWGEDLLYVCNMRSKHTHIYPCCSKTVTRTDYHSQTLIATPQGLHQEHLSHHMYLEVHSADISLNTSSATLVNLFACLLLHLPNTGLGMLKHLWYAHHQHLLTLRQTDTAHSRAVCEANTQPSSHKDLTPRRPPGLTLSVNKSQTYPSRVDKNTPEYLAWISKVRAKHMTPALHN